MLITVIKGRVKRKGSIEAVNDIHDMEGAASRSRGGKGARRGKECAGLAEAQPPDN